MELLRYFYLARRWFWFLVLGTVAGALTAFAVTQQMTPVYRATALLQVDASGGQGAPYSDLSLSERLTRTFATLMVTRPVFDEAIASLQLNMSADDLTGKVSAQAIGGTELMRLTVDDTDPVRAAALANSIGTIFGDRNDVVQSRRFRVVRENLEKELLSVQEQLLRLQEQVDDPPANWTETDLAQQEQLLASYRSNYINLLQSVEEVRLAETQDANTINVVDPAIVPLRPVLPQVEATTALGALIGFLAIAGLVVLLEYVNDKVVANEQVEELLKVPVLAAVGEMPGDKPSEKLVTLRDSYTPVFEAYQMLRVRLEIARFGKTTHSILVASSNQGEGKSTTAANLAVVLARSGKRVVLVDADLRRPTMHRFFGHANVRGLTTALIAPPGSSLDIHVLATKLDTLVLLPSGPLPSDPAALLSSPRLPELIEELQMFADVVIFDSPPLLQVADPALLLSLCDTTILVAAAGRTRTSALARSGMLVAASGSELAGVVLNRVNARNYGYGYGYGYGYSYSYGYAPEQVRGWRGLLRRLGIGRRRRAQAAAVKSEG
jgi:capsular exopolysaccharide synthesis family protein